MARKHGIRLLLQFGSSVTGLVHPDSDVDLAVRLERVPDTLEQEADLITDLQRLVAGHNADVTLINRADPLLLKQIAAHARLVYGTPREFDTFKLFAFKRYQDHRRYLDLEREYVDRALERIASMTLDRELLTRKLLLITADLDRLRRIYEKRRRNEHLKRSHT